MSEEELALYSEQSVNNETIYTEKSSLFSSEDANRYDGIIVYESSSEKARKLVPYILLVAIFLLMILIFRKKL